MASRFWQRYRQSPLLKEIGEKAWFYTRAVAAIYLVREHLVEFTVVSGSGGKGFAGAQRARPVGPPSPFPSQHRPAAPRPAAWLSVGGADA